MAGENIYAFSRNVGISAQKVRLIIDMVRGKTVLDALNILKFVPNAASLPVTKLLTSALSNGEENFGVSREDLFIHRIFADEAPTRRWRRFGARGRFKPWLRRTAHITVILRERET